MTELIKTLSEMDGNFLFGLSLFLIFFMGAISSCFPIIKITKNYHYKKDKDCNCTECSCKTKK